MFEQDCLWKDRKFRWFCLYGQLFIGPVEVLWLKGAYLQEKNLLCSNIDQSQRAMQKVLGSQTKAIQECVAFRLGLIRDSDNMNIINTMIAAIEISDEKLTFELIQL